jgi:hypothetical protein
MLTTVALIAAGVAGLEAVRRLLTDIKWRWSSDEKDAAQRRRHRDDLHDLKMRGAARELPPGEPLRPSVEGSAITTEHPALTDGDPATD